MKMRGTPVGFAQFVPSMEKYRLSDALFFLTDQCCPA